MCNFCGEEWSNSHWYKKRMPLNSFNSTDQSALEQLRENKSIHETLKQVTSTYVLCKSCFDHDNFPKVLTKTDFEKMSLQSMLAGEEQRLEEEKKDEEQEEAEKQGHSWSLEETEKLIDAIGKHQTDWASIAKEAFNNNKTPDECVHRFLALPLTENMIAKIY